MHACSCVGLAGHAWLKWLKRRRYSGTSESTIKKIWLFYAVQLHNKDMATNLNLIRTFMLVAEGASFRTASESAHRSPSAVSAQIRQLEEQLGVQLLHRTTRSVKLTSSGRMLLEASRKGFREIEAGLREIRETVDLQRGQVFLASSLVIAATKIPPLLEIFERDYPTVQVLVREQTPDSVAQSVLNGDVDFGISPMMEGFDIDFEPVMQEGIWALVPRRLYSRDTETIELKELCRMPVLLLSHATALRRLLDAATERQGLRLEPKHECAQAQTLIAMANVQLGAAILPASIIPDRTSRTVRALRIVSPSLKRQIGLITARGHELSPAAARLAQLVRDKIDNVGHRR